MPSDDDGGAQRPMRSAANYVEGPKKNRYLVKWSRFYSTKIPMGVREFVFTGPLLIIVFSIAYFIPELVDVSKFTQGLAPHTQDMREYTLEPMYDEKGQLKGYRHINRKERGGASDEQGQQSMRLTLNHLRRAPQFTNAILQREVDLRGLGLSSLDENALVLLNNDFDVINLTSNALTTLEYFPTTDPAGKWSSMDRVTTLIAHRNRIHKVSVTSCALALPGVTHFLADRNEFRSVRDLLFLRHWKRLEVVSLEGSPVWEGNPEDFDPTKLRAFLVFLCPRLKLVNYARVLEVDRSRADTLKKEFKALIAQWDGNAPTSTSTDGRKTRKRGRDNRGAAAKDEGSAADHAVEKGPAAAPQAANEEAADEAVESPKTAEVVTKDRNLDEETLQARLNHIEQRILSDDITSEEIVALEQEMNELVAEQERRKKRRK